MEGLRLPPELRAAVFSRLGEADLAAASGVDAACLGAACWELSRRGTVLLRPPHTACGLPSAHVVLALPSAEFLPSTLPPGVERLGIYLDSESGVRAAALSRLLEGSVQELILKNAVLNRECCEAVLSSSVSRLVIAGGRLSRQGKRLLLDHRELFHELVLRQGEELLALYPTSGLEAAPHIHYRSGLEVAGTGRRASLDPVSLEALPQPDLSRLTCLRLPRGSQLTDDQLREISRQPLRELVLKESAVSSEALTEAFQAGFRLLRSLELVDCPYLDTAVCQAIAAHQCLERARLDLRHTVEVERCLSLFRDLSSSSLKTLDILYSDNCTFENTRLFELNCKTLQKLLLKNYKHCSLTRDSFSYLISKSNESNVIFVYVNVRTHQRCSNMEQSIKYKY